MTRAKVDEVVVRDGAVKGVRLANGDEIEAAEVVVNAPVWNLNALFADDALPWDLRHRVKMLAANQNKACWFGYWIAAEEPVIASSTLEMASFFTTPRAGLPGYTLCFTGYDPSVSPEGEYLTCVGAAFDATKHYGDRAYYDRKFAELWEDIEEMMPAATRRAVEEAAPRHDLRRHLQARPGRRGTSRHARARRRGPLSDGRHDPRTRHRHRQGGTFRDHDRGDGARPQAPVLRRHGAVLT